MVDTSFLRLTSCIAQSRKAKERKKGAPFLFADPDDGAIVTSGMLHVMFKLSQRTEKKWHRLRDFINGHDLTSES